MIETCFDSLEDLEAATGESASLGSKKRKNNSRAISSITKTTRSKFGHRCDLIFRQYNNQHTVPLEFGATEAKSKMEDECGTNFMSEAFYKLPRTLKDILDCLLQEINFDQRSQKIRTVGLIYSGLSSTLIELDRPTKYIPCITRSKSLAIRKITSSDEKSDNKANKNDIAWFDDCLQRNPPPIMPTTSSSSSESSRKKQKSQHK